MRETKVTNADNNKCPVCSEGHIKYWNLGHYECEACKTLIPEEEVDGIN